MHKWCAFEIKEQPGLIPQMTETAQLVLSLRHMTQLTVRICKMTTCYLSCFLPFFSFLSRHTGGKVEEVFFSSTLYKFWSWLSFPYRIQTYSNGILLINHIEELEDAK